ncbi:MAG TPA: proline dehydrogenase family protein [Woeseiaceae bacterium]|nr:proline dehydrogenase family protein [Woeseiaceae bacterium]
MALTLLHKALVGALGHLPRAVVWHFSQRYIAGTQLEDACRAAQNLQAEGCTSTIDVLGEDSATAAQVMRARDVYIAALQRIQAMELPCNISVKLSEMGLRFDPALTRRVMHELLSEAQARGNFVRIDMEDSSVTSMTLQIYRDLRQHFSNVGVVLQSCLKRSEADAEMLLRDGDTNVRLCKGIYVEPAEIAYRDAGDIRAAYQRLLERLLEGGATRVGIATHDPELIAHAKRTIARCGIAAHRYEMQMLLGVAEPLRRRLVDDGYPLRVYVPFGDLWFRYSLRRLRENPHIAGHLLKNLLSRR